MREILIVITKVIATLIFAPVLGGLLSGIDRKITARMQGRNGPPVLQPFYDVMKLIQKEATTVNRTTRFYTAFLLVFTAFAVVLFFVGQDLLLCIFSFTLACIFFVIAGYSSHSPFSSVGTERELLLIMCYEPMILIVAFGIYKVTGSFNISDVVSLEQPAVVRLPLIFAGLLYVLTIKLRKSPFDLSMSHHGHQELVKGITTELTGICLAIVEITHWFETVFALSIVYIFFVYSWPGSYITAAIICLIIYFAEIIIDNTFARIKWRLALTTSWTVIVALSFANFVILGLI